MKKLKLKWKLFLIANYILLVSSFLSTVASIYTIIKSLPNRSIPAESFLILIVFILGCLTCLFNIVIVNRYFPDNLLPIKYRKMLTLSRIIMIVVSLIIGMVVMGLIALYTDSAKGADLATVLGICYFGFLFILCLYITILQFQINGYLNRQSTGNINQLIDSIGK